MSHPLPCPSNAPRPKVRHLFTDQEIVYLYNTNTLERMAEICSRRAGRKLSHETMRLWALALEKRGLVVAGGMYKAPIPVTREQLKNLYVTRKKSSTQIAELLANSGINTDGPAVLRWLAEYGIQVRSHKEAGKIAKKRNILPLPLSDAEILEKYNSGISHQKLAELLSTPDREVYPMAARAAVIRAHERLGGDLRPRIKNTWGAEVLKNRQPAPAIRGAICPKCGKSDSVSSGGYRCTTTTKGKDKGIAIERATFKCRACDSLWYRKSPAGWVAKMRESGEVRP